MIYDDLSLELKITTSIHVLKTKNYSAVGRIENNVIFLSLNVIRSLLFVDFLEEDKARCFLLMYTKVKDC